jgi:chloramphenicol O-acetyltransferase
MSAWCSITRLSMTSASARSNLPHQPVSAECSFAWRYTFHFCICILSDSVDIYLACSSLFACILQIDGAVIYLFMRCAKNIYWYKYVGCNSWKCYDMHSAHFFLSGMQHKQISSLRFANMFIDNLLS